MVRRVVKARERGWEGKDELVYLVAGGVDVGGVEAGGSVRGMKKEWMTVGERVSRREMTVESIVMVVERQCDENHLFDIEEELGSIRVLVVPYSLRWTTSGVQRYAPYISGILLSPDLHVVYVSAWRHTLSYSVSTHLKWRIPWCNTSINVHLARIHEHNSVAHNVSESTADSAVC